jgi:hypothetical protein
MEERFKKPISKMDAAARQLETAIDLYFSNGDSLSVHTLAHAAFRILFDLYPHLQSDDFSKQIDAMIQTEGWKPFSRTANFLKHADRDPHETLPSHHPQEAMSIVGLATLLYRRISGDFTLKMKAFDYWAETEGYEDLGLEELDTNTARAAEHKKIREHIRALLHDEKIVVAREHYQFFIENFDHLSALSAEGDAAGLTTEQIIDNLESSGAAPSKTVIS